MSRALLYSQRKLVVESFKSHCELRKQSYCIENFLSWLTHSSMGQETTKRLHEAQENDYFKSRLANRKIAHRKGLQKWESSSSSSEKTS